MSCRINRSKTSSKIASINTYIAAMAFGSALLLNPAAHASDRTFAFLQDATVSDEGQIEYEQYITWESHKQSDKGYTRVEIQHEFEFGIAPGLQLSIYAATWSFENSDDRNHHTRYDSSGAELKYQIYNPHTDPFGLALYTEFTGGPEVLESENKIIVQKIYDKFNIAWNGIFEFEWEGDRYAEKNFKLEHNLGAMYEIFDNLLVGAELLHEFELHDYENWGRGHVYLGPSLSYRYQNIAFSLAELFQVTDSKGEPDFLSRFLLEIEF